MQAISTNIPVRGFQIDDCVLQSGLNFANLKCQVYIKDWGLEKETKVYPRFSIENKTVFLCSFTYIFPDYVGHDITKEF